MCHFRYLWNGMFARAEGQNTTYNKYIYIYVYVCVCVCGILDWRLSQPDFDPSFGNLACLATLKSSDRTKQVDDNIYIYIYKFRWIYKTFKSKRYTLQPPGCSSSYKGVVYIQKLPHICNTSSADDDPKSGRKYLGNKQPWKLYQPIPAEYYIINTAILKDQQENM